MINLLFLIKKLSFDGKDPWLFDDLLDSLSSENVRKNIFLLDYSGKFKFGLNIKGDNYIYAFPIKTNIKFLKVILTIFANIYFISLLSFSSSLRKDVRPVTSSIASLFFLVHVFLKLIIKPKRSLLIIWDFFPIHHVQISSASRILEKPLWILERICVSCYDSIGVMSSGNMDFFSQYFSFNKHVFILPIWAKDRKLKQHTLDDNNLKCIFGGQITQGRGIREIVSICECIDKENIPVKIDVFGDGNLSKFLKDEIKIKNIKSLVFHGKVSRENYINNVARSDVGLIVTVPNVTVPTYPSKVLDYMVSSKPVFSIVENTTDFGLIIEKTSKCGLSADVEDLDEVVRKLKLLVDYKRNGQLKEMGNNSRRYFESVHDVNVVKMKLLEKLR